MGVWSVRQAPNRPTDPVLGGRVAIYPILIKVKRRVCHPEEVDGPRTEMPPKELVPAWQLF